MTSPAATGAGTADRAREFLDLSYFRLHEVTPPLSPEPDPATAPLPFKVYRDCELLPLCQVLPFRIGPVVFGPESSRPAVEVPGGRPDWLSMLLYFGYGLSRYDSGPGVQWRYHRFVASARCLYPTELYLVAPPGKGLPPGVYHYDNLHHGLALLSPGDQTQEVHCCLRGEATGQLLVVATTLFMKTAYRYYDFAYRLVNQEAGLTAGNVLLVAAALGVRTRTMLQFDDRRLNQLLGLEESEESAVAVMAVDGPPSVRQLPSQAHPFSVADDRRRRAARAYAGRRRMDEGRCSRLIELDRCARQDGDRPTVVEWPEAGPCRHAGDDRCLAIEGQELGDLADALRYRSSGDSWFRAEPAPIPGSALKAVLEKALTPIVTDIPLRAVSLTLDVVVNRVQGVRPGVYEWCAGCERLRTIAVRDVSRQLQEVYFQPGVNCSAASFVCYLSASFEDVFAALGNRAYRVGHILAGIVAQRLSVAGAAVGLAVRCSDAYDTSSVQRLLGRQGTSSVPVFQLIAGRERPGAGGGERYRHKIRF